MTVVRDEQIMLPRWVSYYASQLGMESLIVIDDNSTDGSTSGLDCTVHRIPGFHPRKFNSERDRLVSGLASGLLVTYDAVLYTDVDEFLVADPARYDGLRDLVRARKDQPVLAPLALNVVHHPEAEGALRRRRPVIGQRQFAKFAPIMCKPSIKRVAAPWVFASHGIKAPYAVDPELFMLHLKFADTEAFRAVATKRNQLVAELGRGSASTWATPADQLIREVNGALVGVDPATVPEFDPTAVDLDGLVVAEQNGVWRAPREGQLGVMKRQPLVRIPSRLHGLL
jgi:hypothetical protein